MPEPTQEQEVVVLVDELDRVLGTAPKTTVHSATTPLHRGFSLFLFDRARRLLLQRRALRKHTWPGVWSNSCCGHPAPDETVQLAARRRAQFELGVSVDAWIAVADFRYRAELDGLVENEICPILVALCEDQPRPRRDEVEEVRWMAWEEFVAATRERPGDWSPWSVLEVERLQDDPRFRRWLADAVDGPRDVA
jgi:isopentenyl-diphosphate delta-isomerase